MNKWVLEAVVKGTAASDADCPGDVKAKIAVPPKAPVKPDNSAQPVTRAPAPVVCTTRSTPGLIVSLSVDTAPSAPVSGSVSAAPVSLVNLSVNCDAWAAVQTIRNVVIQPSPFAICGMVFVAAV